MAAAEVQPVPSDHAPLRCVSIDVEEYYHIEAAYGTIARDQWHSLPSRLDYGVCRLLDLFDRQNQRGTFFVLGDAARRCPNAIRRIADAGHEIASHGTNHDRLQRLDPDAFREDVRTGRQILEDLTGQAVIGYRAPSWSLTRDTAWAVDVLAELGFRYDASVFPVKRKGYGIVEAPITPFHIRSRPDGPKLLEVPALIWQTRLKKVPVAGGGYFRLFPLWLMRKGLTQAAGQGRPSVLYFHPWEFDPDQPRMALSLKNRIRTYTGIRRAEARLESVMKQPARWRPIREMLDDLTAIADRNDPFTAGA